LVDFYYGTIAEKASILKPEEIFVEAEMKEEFLKFFGISWN